MHDAQPRVLVTGGTGNLGSKVVAALHARGAVPRVLSRRARPSESPARQEWATADLVSGDLGPAVRGVDAVVHLASEKGRGDADVLATGRLLDAARAATVRHVVVISIVGCDRIPLPFYASKVRIEGAVRAGGIPWTLVRVTQFHSFVERLVSAAATLPIPAPIFGDLRFQPVDEGEVAERLVDLALGPPTGDAPEIAGPEVLTLGEIAAAWLAASGRPATIVPATVSAGVVETGGVLQPERWVAGVLEAYRDGLDTPRGAPTLGRVTFTEWLRRRASPLPPSARP
jgi:uncharacterized protein YbjT (DUF2867 family)